MKIVIRDDEKKDKAVSAIIGTILIVAITVVLAATLYAVLGGFSGLIGKPTPTASMTVSSSGVGTSSGTENYTLSFTSVSSSLDFTDIQVRAVTSGGSSMTSTAFTSSGVTPPVALAATMTTTISGATVTFTVNVYNVGTGNTLTFNTLITITTSGTSSTPATALSSITLIDTSTGGTIASASNV